MSSCPNLRLEKDCWRNYPGVFHILASCHGAGGEKNRRESRSGGWVPPHQRCFERGAGGELGRCVCVKGSKYSASLSWGHKRPCGFMKERREGAAEGCLLSLIWCFHCSLISADSGLSLAFDFSWVADRKWAKTVSTRMVLKARAWCAKDHPGVTFCSVQPLTKNRQ